MKSQALGTAIGDSFRADIVKSVPAQPARVK
jgi:hypothetical protein